MDIIGINYKNPIGGGTNEESKFTISPSILRKKKKTKKGMFRITE